MNLKLNAKRIAEQQGFTKMSLSRKADLNIATVNKIWKDPDEEIGIVETPTLEKLAQALNVSIRDLIAEE